MENYIEFIKSCWKDFIEKGNVNPKVRTEISDSWKRCKKYGVNPMNGKGNDKYNVPVKVKIMENAELISVARPIMESVYDIVAGSEFAIILTDKDGYVIDVVGDEPMLKRMDELNFVKGALWSEEIVGTNAIGTALYMDKPIQTIGAEHYCLNQHSWTCSGSPIHDEDGNIIGCINMSGNYYNAHSHTLGIVTSAAKSIQKQLALTISNKLMKITFDFISEGMIVLDENLKIKRVNNRALEILNVRLEDILNMNIEENLKGISFHEIINKNDRSFNNVECDFYIKNNGSKLWSKCGKDSNSQEYGTSKQACYDNLVKCIINAVPMKVNGKLVGIVITFSESKYVHKLVNKVVGYKATYTFNDIITENEKMKEMIRFAKKAAKSDCNMLIEGESGTGKELIAQSVHNYSNRSNGPFVAINCASIPRELVESELFGYEKGAFTGASKEGHPGKFELSDGGTIFLDEIGELPLDIQSKLLRVLDNNKISRIGGTYEKQLNVRVIGATNRILKKEIEKRNFREDLYYRLSVMNIKTIPLNNRKDDIELLANYFVKILDRKSGSGEKKLKKDYIESLKNYSWNGNVRELRNVVERDYYLSDTDIISSNCLQEKSYAEENSVENVQHNSIKTHTNMEFHNNIEPMHILEKEAIENALKKCYGNRAKASKLLNIGRSTLYRKIKKYGIKEL